MDKADIMCVEELSGILQRGNTCNSKSEFTSFNLLICLVRTSLLSIISTSIWSSDSSRYLLTPTITSVNEGKDDLWLSILTVLSHLGEMCINWICNFSHHCLTFATVDHGLPLSGAFLDLQLSPAWVSSKISKSHHHNLTSK